MKGTLILRMTFGFGALSPIAGNAQSAALDSVPCKAPISQVPLKVPLTYVQGSIPGEYALRVVATSGVLGDAGVRGKLSLRRTPSRLSRMYGSTLILPVYGWSDVDVASIAGVSLAYSPASRDTLRPGVQGIFDSTDGTLTFVVGNAIAPDALTTDAGLLFRVEAVDSLGFRGTWQDGGITKPLAAGYYCAARVAADR